MSTTSSPPNPHYHSGGGGGAASVSPPMTNNTAASPINERDRALAAFDFDDSAPNFAASMLVPSPSEMRQQIQLSQQQQHQQQNEGPLRVSAELRLSSDDDDDLGIDVPPPPPPPPPPQAQNVPSLEGGFELDDDDLPPSEQTPAVNNSYPIAVEDAVGVSATEAAADVSSETFFVAAAFGPRPEQQKRTRQQQRPMRRTVPVVSKKALAEWQTTAATVHSRLRCFEAAVGAALSAEGGWNYESGSSGEGGAETVSKAAANTLLQALETDPRWAPQYLHQAHAHKTHRHLSLSSAAAASPSPAKKIGADDYFGWAAANGGGEGAASLAAPTSVFYGPIVSAAVGWAYGSAEDAIAQEGGDKEGAAANSGDNFYCSPHSPLRQRSARGAPTAGNNTVSGFSRDAGDAEEEEGRGVLCGFVLTASTLLVVAFEAPPPVDDWDSDNEDNGGDDSEDEGGADGRINVYSESPAAVAGAPNLSSDAAADGTHHFLQLSATPQRGGGSGDSESPPPPPSESASPQSLAASPAVVTPQKKGMTNGNSKTRPNRPTAATTLSLPRCHVVAEVPTEYLASLGAFASSEVALDGLRLAMLRRIEGEEESADEEEAKGNGNSLIAEADAVGRGAIVLEVTSVDLDVYNASGRARANFPSPVAHQPPRGRAASSSSSASSSATDASSDDEGENDGGGGYSLKATTPAEYFLASYAHTFPPLAALSFAFSPLSGRAIDNPPADELVSDMVDAVPSLRLALAVLTPSVAAARIEERRAHLRSQQQHNRGANNASVTTTMMGPKAAAFGTGLSSITTKFGASATVHQLPLPPPPLPPLSLIDVASSASPVMLRRGQSQQQQQLQQSQLAMSFSFSSPIARVPAPPVPALLQGEGKPVARQISLSVSPSAAAGNASGSGDGVTAAIGDADDAGSPLGLSRYRYDPTTGVATERENVVGASAKREGVSVASPSMRSSRGFFEAYRRTLASPNAGEAAASTNRSRLPSPPPSGAGSPLRLGASAAALGVLAPFYGGKTYALVAQSASPRQTDASGGGELLDADGGGGGFSSASVRALFAIVNEEQIRRAAISESSNGRLLSLAHALWGGASKIATERAAAEVAAIKQTHTTVAVKVSDPSSRENAARGLLPVTTPAAVGPDGKSVQLVTLTALADAGTAASAAVNAAFEPSLVASGAIKRPLNDDVSALIAQHERSTRQRMGIYYTKATAEALGRARDVEWSAFAAAHSSQLSKAHSEASKSKRAAAQLSAAAAEAEAAKAKLEVALAEAAAREAAVLERGRRREEALHAELQRERAQTAALVAQLRSAGVEPLGGAATTSSQQSADRSAPDAPPVVDAVPAPPRRRNFSLFGGN